jgi:GNAT superfamily N-acetyltransferase
MNNESFARKVNEFIDQYRDALEKLADSPMQITYRPAQPSDARDLTGLLRSIGGFREIDNETFEQTEEHLSRNLVQLIGEETSTVLVAEDEQGAVVGYVSVHWQPHLIHARPEGYISELFVLETVRGQGIGARLLELVQAEARKRNCGRLLLLNIRTRESYQRQFYKKHGWFEWEDAATFVYMFE